MFISGLLFKNFQHVNIVLLQTSKQIQERYVSGSMLFLSDSSLGKKLLDYNRHHKDVEIP